MLIYYLIYILILCALITCFFEKYLEKVFFCIICILLTFFAGLRGLGVSRDMFNYVLMFDNVNSYTDKMIFDMEPMAKVIPVTLKHLGIYYYWTAFLSFAIISIPLKFKSIAKYSPLPLLSVLLYYSYFYLLQDFTQIRAAVAAAIYLWSIQDIINKNIKQYYFKMILASLFHFSSIILFPLYLFNSETLKKRVYIFALIICFIIGLLRINIFAGIPFLGAVGDKIDRYVSLSNAADLSMSGVLTITNLLYMTICIIFILFIDTLKNKDKHAIIFTKLLTYSLCTMFIINPFSFIISGRFFELTSCTTIISFMYFKYIFRPQYAGILVTIFISMYFFNLYVMRVPIVSSYFFNF